MPDYHPWTLDSFFHTSSAQTAPKENKPFVKGSVSLLLNTCISCNYCQQKVTMIANLGKAVTCVVFNVILLNFTPQGRWGRWIQGRPHLLHTGASYMYVSFTGTEAPYLILNVMDHFREGRHLLPRTLLFIFTRKCSQHLLSFSMYLLSPFRRNDSEQTLFAQNKWPLMSNKISWEAGGYRTVFKWDSFFFFHKEVEKTLALKYLTIC